MATSYDYTLDRALALTGSLAFWKTPSATVRPAIGRPMTSSRRVTAATASRLRLPASPKATLDITFQTNLLTVTGKKQDFPSEAYLHRGIAGRPFEHRFELADHVRVSGAGLSNDLLTIDLVREIPEALKPRKISIQRGSALGRPDAAPQIEAQGAA
ncbi:hypothetical protein ABIA24_005330 [Sinorhizobium fredii]